MTAIPPPSAVSVRRVGFSLTRANIRDALAGRRLHLRTRYIVFRNGKTAAVARVVLEEGKELLRPVKRVRILALPEDTSFIRRRKADLLNPTEAVAAAMAVPAYRTGRKSTAVVEGMFGHVTVVHRIRPVSVTVMDVVPPFPPKLLTLARKAVNAGLIRRPVELKPLTVDLRELAGPVRDMMLPCTGPGMRLGGRRSLFLDRSPPLKKEKAASITLLGCRHTLSVFRSLYGTDPARLASFCPKDIPQSKIQNPKSKIKPVMARCCEVLRGVRVSEGTVLLPWGPTIREVARAVERAAGMAIASCGTAVPPIRYTRNGDCGTGKAECRRRGAQ